MKIECVLSLEGVHPVDDGKVLLPLKLSKAISMSIDCDATQLQAMFDAHIQQAFDVTVTRLFADYDAGCTAAEKKYLEDKQKKEAEAKKAEEDKKQAEAKKLEEAKKAEEAKKKAESKKQ